MNLLKASILVTTTSLMLVSVGLLHAGNDVGLDRDYRTFHHKGKTVYGKISDSYTSNLVIYLSGNQFMVIDDLIKDFQKANPDIKTIYVQTIPSGKILKGQILKQGVVNGQQTAMNPDLFASVSIAHLVRLKKKGLMSNYMIYTHNKLELMVAKGNPKDIQGPEDLARDDIVQSQPNPLTEGIFKFYGSHMLKQLGLYEKVTAKKKCRSCWAIKDKTWFTSRHHRETPYRIENGKADVGIVWATEIKHAQASGRAIDGVSIQAPYNMADQVGYAIGRLTTGRNQKNALRFQDYLASKEAQSIYSRYGFVKASTAELKLKKIPG